MHPMLKGKNLYLKGFGFYCFHLLLSPQPRMLLEVIMDVLHPFLKSVSLKPPYIMVCACAAKANGLSRSHFIHFHPLGLACSPPTSSQIHVLTTSHASISNYFPHNRTWLKYKLSFELFFNSFLATSRNIFPLYSRMYL